MFVCTSDAHQRPTDGLLTASIQKWEMRCEKGSETEGRTERERGFFVWTRHMRKRETSWNERGGGAFTLSGGVTIS